MSTSTVSTLTGPLAALKVNPHPLNLTYEHLELLISRDDPSVTIVALNRPRKRNAMNSQLWKEIGRVFSSLGTTGDACRVVLLVGNGSCFSAGIDITDPAFLPAPKDNAAHTGLAFLPKLAEMQACFTALEHCPVPVVAAIHGSCIGAGIDLITAADIRLCDATANFGVREVALGLAADVGTLQRLPKVVGNASLARELCLTGQDFSSAIALEMGLVSRIAKLNVIQEALQVCAKIAQHGPVAVRGTKQALVYARDHSVQAGLEQVGAYNALALQSDDLVAAWTARTTKKKPVFGELPAYSRL